jgi:prepilin-type N-terminal cleavage/methylation domain-containing protein
MSSRWLQMLRRARDESGMTLPEIMVVMSVLSIVMIFSLTSVASFERATTGQIRRLENLEEGRVLMAVVTKDVRTAVRMSSTTSPFIRADDHEVQFYANLNLSTACPKIIWVHVDSSSRLLEEVWDPDPLTSTTPPNCSYLGNPLGNPPTGATRTRLVGRYVANTATEPIFTYYYDNAGTLTAFCHDTTLPCILDVTPLTSTDSFVVTAVQVRLSIHKDTISAVGRTTLVNTVRLPNVFYNPEETPSPSPTA